MDRSTGRVGSKNSWILAGWVGSRLFRVGSQNLDPRATLKIARQLHTQYVEGIYNKSATLKSMLRVTEGHWKRNHWIDHTRLTVSRVIWIISWPWYLGERSLKVIETGAIRKLGCCFLFAFCSNYGRVCSRLWYSTSKNGVTLKTGLAFVPTSLEMATFDRSHTSSY